jgi:hypothetical protein|tara:strand:- start:379 stop:483 length:105 start_codon:yes stop_codon:yes gene_type:complete
LVDATEPGFAWFIWKLEIQGKLKNEGEETKEEEK